MDAIAIDTRPINSNWDAALARYLATRQAAAAEPLQFKGGVSAELEEERIAMIADEMSAAFDDLAATQPVDGNALAAKLEAFAFQREDIPMDAADFAVLIGDARRLQAPAIDAGDVADRASVIADYLDLLLRGIWSNLEGQSAAEIDDARMATNLALEMVQRLRHLDTETV